MEGFPSHRGSVLGYVSSEHIEDLEITNRTLNHLTDDELIELITDLEHVKATAEETLMARRRDRPPLQIEQTAAQELEMAL